MWQALAVLADPLFEGIAVAYTVRSIAAAAGRLPDNIVLLNSTKLVADAVMVAHAGRSHCPRRALIQSERHTTPVALCVFDRSTSEGIAAKSRNNRSEIRPDGVA